jgi:hypothetical protein
MEDPNRNRAMLFIHHDPRPVSLSRVAAHRQRAPA